jgi:hypothetical protein
MGHQQHHIRHAPLVREERRLRKWWRCRGAWCSSQYAAGGGGGGGFSMIKKNGTMVLVAGGGGGGGGWSSSGGSSLEPAVTVARAASFRINGSPSTEMEYYGYGGTQYSGGSGGSSGQSRWLSLWWRWLWL